MQPFSPCSRRRLLALPLTFSLALSLASFAAAQRPRFDPADLDHDYARIALPVGLERRTLRAFENTPEHNAVQDEGAALGRVLFYDRLLSKNRRTACASCHRQEHAFADPRAASRGFERGRTRRNSMSLANLAYYTEGRFFWDERGATLEEMVLMPIQDEVEMGLTLVELIERLEADVGYRWLFAEAFGDTRVTQQRVAFALAQFLRSMESFSSPFDRGLARAGALEKPFPNFSRQENAGKRLFLETCATCHLQDTRPENHDPMPHVDDEGRLSWMTPPVLFQGVGAANNGLDADPEVADKGRFEVTAKEADRGKFKTPSLRNVELTGPYMHDGRLVSLAQVVEHYSKGIQSHPNLDARLKQRARGGWGSDDGGPGRPVTATLLPPIVFGVGGGMRGRFNHGLPGLSPLDMDGDMLVDDAPRRSSSSGFQFTGPEKKALVAFMRTLTDEQFVNDPRFSDPLR